MTARMIPYGCLFVMGVLCLRIIYDEEVTVGRNIDEMIWRNVPYLALGVLLDGALFAFRNGDIKNTFILGFMNILLLICVAHDLISMRRKRDDRNVYDDKGRKLIWFEDCGGMGEWYYADTRDSWLAGGDHGETDKDGHSGD